MIEVIVSIIVCIFLSVSLALEVPIHEDLLVSLKKLIKASAFAGSVGTVVILIELMSRVMPTILTPSGFTAWVLQVPGLLLSLSIAWFLDTLIGFVSAFVIHILRLFMRYSDMYMYSSFSLLD